MLQDSWSPGSGLPVSLLLLPVGVATAAVLFIIRVGGHREAQSATDNTQPANKRLVALLATITAFRSIATQSIVTFLPLYFVAKGNSILSCHSYSVLMDGHRSPRSISGRLSLGPRWKTPRHSSLASCRRTVVLRVSDTHPNPSPYYYWLSRAVFSTQAGP